MEPQYPLLSEGKLRMLWRGALKEHRPRKETYSEYLIYGYFYIRLPIHLYVERSDREGKENMPISSYPHINISIYYYTDSQSSDRRRHRFTAWTATSRRLPKIWQELPHHIDSKIVTNMLVDEMVKCCYSLSIFQIWFIVASVSQPSTIFKNLKHIIASLLK